jgi:hypothetical protein
VNAVKMVEGVPYVKFVVRYTLADGKRRRMMRWSPGMPWVRYEIGRELVERFGVEGIKPGSVTIGVAR